MRSVLPAVAALLAAGCAVGPSYVPAAPMPADARVAAAPRRGDARTFFDSLAAARAADTIRADMQSATPQPSPLVTTAAGGLLWLDVLRDTVLVDLVRTALQENRDLQGAVARIREFRARVGVARAPLYPTLTANASAATNRVVFGAAGTVEFDLYQATGAVAWELDFWGRSRRGVEATLGDLAGQEAARDAVGLTLVSDIATGYLRLLELDQERAIAARTLESRRATLELARSRFRQGVTSELDVRQFEAQVGAPAAALAQIERQLAEQEHQLSQLIGAAPRQIPRGSTLAAAVTAVAVPDSLPAVLITRRPDVRQAEAALKAATARVGVAEAARLPAVTVTGLYGLQSQSVSRLFNDPGDAYQVQAGISLPLFTGGRLTNERRAAEARVEQARAAYEQQALVALREAGDALAAVRTSRDEVAAQATQVAALQRALQLAELRYRSGVATYLEVLDAQRGLFTAEVALSQAQFRQLAATVLLYRALGGGWNG